MDIFLRKMVGLGEHSIRRFEEEKINNFNIDKVDSRHLEDILEVKNLGIRLTFTKLIRRHMVAIRVSQLFI